MSSNVKKTLRFLGAAGTVTGSRYLIEIGKRRILVDCGLFQGFKTLRERNRKPFPVRPALIDTVLLTHAHLDHSGYLPALVRASYAGKVHCAEATNELCGLILPDSGHIQEEEARYAKRNGYSRHKNPTPLYTSKDADAALLASLRNPDRHALPLRFAAATAREMGARRVGLVAPYLGYMRQDRRFQDGQAVGAPLFAQFLGDSFDWLVTVDPHLQRIAHLKDVFPMQAISVASAPLLADWITANLSDAVLFGPDIESQQWVAEVARLAGRPYEVLRKIRKGDLSVEISVPESAALRKSTPVILDDIASSSRTMARAIERLIAAGARAPVCVVIHAVFAGSAYHDILAAGAARIITTNTIPHHSNAVQVAALVARGMGKILQSPAAEPGQ